MSDRRIIAWFRNDLRVHDNEMLAEAVNKSDQILPVYFFDPRHFGETVYSTKKTGYLRTKFLIESVAALRETFQGYGGDLLIIHGYPEEHLPLLVENYGITEVYHHREVASEETLVSSNVEDALWKLRINLKHFIGHTLYNKEDLPFPIKDIPDDFARFKKKAEREAIVKPSIETPADIHFLTMDAYGELPEPLELSGDAPTENMEILYHGGEQASFRALAEVIEDICAHAPRRSKKLFSNLSPWLSLGCLSPRKVYWDIKAAEQIYGHHTLFLPMLRGLLWRDYFRFMFKKYGSQFFKLTGMAEKLPYEINKDTAAFIEWKSALTPNATVNAIMSRVNNTGSISHEWRIFLATYLVEILHVDWTLGAAYFEEKLLDYTPPSNWGSWAHVAGVGNGQSQKPSPDFDSQLKLIESSQDISVLIA